MRRLLPVLLVVALSACSLIPASLRPSPSSWTGKVSLTSSSVPNPYNWSRTADVNGASVTLTMTWFATDSRSDPGTKKTWQRTITQAEVDRVNALVKELNPGARSSAQPGSCGATVDLRGSDGQTVKVSDGNKGENYPGVVSLYDILAGPDAPLLPAHSYKCQS